MLRIICHPNTHIHRVYVLKIEKAREKAKFDITITN